ncbi:unnamed protein product [Schistosoma curassoni]|nr:unnamed protein product [Schistosoma curassoni]
MDVQLSLMNFSEKFYGKILEENKICLDKLENTFLSPFNIYTTLGMVLSGSALNTKAEIMKTMQLSERLEHDKVHSGISELLNNCSKRGGVNIILSSGLFVERDVSIKQQFEIYLKTYYNALIEHMTFQTDIECARKRINKWVSEQTNGKIQQLLSPGSLEEDTRVVVLATTYFKGLWESAFPVSNSHVDKFFRLDRSKIDVRFMYINSSFGMVSLPHLKSRAIKIPFKSPKFSLLVVLPNTNDGLPDLLKSLCKDKGISSILSSNFTDTSIHLYLPKFKLKEGSAISLVDYLQKMGMREAFCPGSANFTNMSESSNFCIGDILHKAILEVDERGAVAAAATSAKVIPRSLCISKEPEVKFRVDHPFFIAIIWNNTVPVFLGHVVAPTE